MTSKGSLSARGLLAGAAAGAAGTTALNAVTYLDMALRSRPASSTPEDAVEKLSEVARVPVPGDKETSANRVAGLAPLTGLLAGVGTAAMLGALRSADLRPGLAASSVAAVAGAMIASTAPMTALRITDPRTWTAQAWASDVIPHLAYGAFTATVLQHLDSPP
jgi:hypothetical protein